MQSKMIEQICAQIAHCFHEGDNGFECYFVVSRSFPFALNLAKPVLVDFDKVMALARQQPHLAEVVEDPEFEPFAREFCDAAAGKEPPDEEPPDPAAPPAPVPAQRRPAAAQARNGKTAAGDSGAETKAA